MTRAFACVALALMAGCRPVTWKAPAPLPREKEPAESPPPYRRADEFDPQDFARTCEWAVGRERWYQDGVASHGPNAFGGAVEYDRRFQEVVGKKLRWHVDAAGLEKRGGGHDVLFLPAKEIIRRMPEENVKAWELEHVDVGVSPLPVTPEQALNVRRGTELTVEGVIDRAEVRRDRKGYHAAYIVTLRSPKVVIR